MLKATIIGRDAFISQLQGELQVSKNVESYFAYKLSKWKDIGISNRIQNLDLVRHYLDIESVSEILRDKLVKYERLVFGNEYLKSRQPMSHRTSLSSHRIIFPDIPMRPDQIPLSYFGVALSSIEDLEVLKLVKIDKKKIDRVFPCAHDVKCKWVLNHTIDKNRKSYKFVSCKKCIHISSK